MKARKKSIKDIVGAKKLKKAELKDIHGGAMGKNANKEYNGQPKYSYRPIVVKIADSFFWGPAGFLAEGPKGFRRGVGFAFRD